MKKKAWLLKGPSEEDSSLLKGKARGIGNELVVVLQDILFRERVPAPPSLWIKENAAALPGPCLALAPSPPGHPEVCCRVQRYM